MLLKVAFRFGLAGVLFCLGARGITDNSTEVSYVYQDS